MLFRDKLFKYKLLMIYKQAVKIGKGSVLTGLHILYKKYME